MVRLLRTLLWPRLENISAAQSALLRGMWVCFACAFLAAIGGYGLVQGASGLLLWLAILQVCGLVLIGLGTGAGSRLAALSAVALSAANLIAAAFLFRQRPLILAIEAVILLLLIASARAALSLAPSNQPAWWRKSRIYLEAATAISTAFLLLSLALLIAFRAFIMPSGAMEPTLRIGDRFFALLPAFMGSVQRGDLVIVAMPGPHKSLVVKRVVGLAGDRLQLVSGHLLLDGKTLAEPYVLSPSPFPVLNFPVKGTPMSIGADYTPLVAAMYRNDVRNDELVVPPGRYFVLGDNRGNSLDSRYFGPIAANSVLGRPVYVYASAKATPTPPHALTRYSLHP